MPHFGATTVLSTVWHAALQVCDMEVLGDVEAVATDLVESGKHIRCAVPCCIGLQPTIVWFFMANVSCIWPAWQVAKLIGKFYQLSMTLHPALQQWHCGRTILVVVVQQLESVSSRLNSNLPMVV